MTSNAKTSLRLANKPFIIRLKRPFVLNETDLKRQVDDSLLRKQTIYRPDLRIIDVKDNVAKLLLSENESYEMQVKIEPHKLHISCSCGQAVDTLCLHTYRVLDGLFVGRPDTTFFKTYIKNGLYEMAKKYPKYFYIEEVSKDCPQVGPIGYTSPHLFRLSDNTDRLNLNKLLAWPSGEHKPVHPGEKETTDIAYVFITSPRFDYFPFWYPCKGELHTSNVFIQRLIYFVDIDNEQEPPFSYMQQVINSYCYFLHEFTQREDPKEVSVRTKQLFAYSLSMHKKALPLLLTQPHLHVYYRYSSGRVRGRPRLSDMQEIKLSSEKPTLTFELYEDDDFYTFEMCIQVKEKVFKNFDSSPIFYINIDDTLYLLSALKDVGMILWMRQYSNRLVIFKEYFDDFKENYLNRISEFYKIKFSLKRETVIV